MAMTNEYNIVGRGLLSLPLQEDGFPVIRDSNNDEYFPSAIRTRVGINGDGTEFTLYDYDVTPVTDVTLKSTTTVTLNTAASEDNYEVFVSTSSICNRFEINDNSIDTASLTVDVSTDGAVWNEITDTFIEEHIDGVIHVEFTNNTAYNYYRFSIPDTEPDITTTDISLHLNDVSFTVETSEALDNVYDGSVKVYKAPFTSVDGNEASIGNDWARVYGTNTVKNFNNAIIIDNGLVRVVLNGVGATGNGYVAVFGYVNTEGETGWRHLVTSGEDWKVARVSTIETNKYNEVVIKFTHEDRNGVQSTSRVTLTRGMQMAQFETVSWGAGALASQYFTNSNERFKQVFSVDEGVIDINTATTQTIDTSTENWLLMQRDSQLADTVLSSSYKNVFKIKVSFIVNGMGSGSMASKAMGLI